MTTAIRTDAFANLQLGAGVFLKNFALQAGESAAALRGRLVAAVRNGTGLLGMTRGGGTFRAVPRIRQLEADGLRTPVVGSEMLDSWEIRLTGSLLEMTPENFAMALGAGEVAWQGDMTTVIARPSLREEDYIPLLCWVGDTASGLMLIAIEGALNTAGLCFTFTDKGEGVLPFDLLAHGQPGEENPPFRVIFLDGEEDEE